MLLDFFKEKYGEEISQKLLSNDTLTGENISKENDASQKLVQNHLHEINGKLNLGLLISKSERWAFDFSGWLDSLNPAKKYMIVGLEPHVERYDYQITYGLSNKTPLGENRFDIDKSKSDMIRCEDDSDIIWSNIFKILANDDQIKEVTEDANIDTMLAFLKQFYITDLCHFAPKDKAKAVNDIKQWNKIRFEVANHFIKTEIDIVKPKVIITQGNKVFNNLKRILKFKESTSYPLKFGKLTWSVKTANCSNDSCKIIAIPHFGSKMNNNTFYKNNIGLVRQVLFDNKLVD